MARLISTSFRYLKPHSSPSCLKRSPEPSSSSCPATPPEPPPILSPRSPSKKPKSKSSWSVYLILSTNTPIKTYVGVTTNFSRRLKQHNGELKGGAKASRAGRPWVCACIVKGFKDRSEEALATKTMAKVLFRQAADLVSLNLDGKNSRGNFLGQGNVKIKGNNWMMVQSRCCNAGKLL